MASNSGDYPGTNFPENINDWTAAQREEVGQALGVYGNPKITAGLEVLGKDPPAGEVTKADLQEEKTPTPTTTPGPAPESAYEQLANAQADQYLAATKSINNLTADYTSPNTQAGVNANAESMIGVSSSSPMSQWLNQQTQAAATQFAPTAAAESQLTAAENQGAKMEASGLKQMGQAETAEINAAPYTQLLNALASEVPYHLAQGWNFPGLVGKQVLPGIQLAETGAGVSTTGQSTAGGGIPTLPSIQQAGGTQAVSPTNPTPTTYP